MSVFISRKCTLGRYLFKGKELCSVLSLPTRNTHRARKNISPFFIFLQQQSRAGITSKKHLTKELHETNFCKEKQQRNFLGCSTCSKGKMFGALVGWCRNGSCNIYRSNHELLKNRSVGVTTSGVASA